MPPFSRSRGDTARLDWRLLQNGPVMLYLRDRVLDGDCAWLEANGYRLARFDCREWVDGGAMHRAFASAFSFPDHYGMNLDALNDCLSDIEIPAEGGLVFDLRRFDAFAAHDRHTAQTVLDILASNARTSNSRRGK